MLIVYIALFALLLYKAKFSGKGFFAEDSFSREVTDSVKGFFIWLVFLSHFASYVTYTGLLDQMGARISSLLGQLIVACFLFYSGYGVCEAIKKRGCEYVRMLPKNRLAKTMLHFALAVLIFLMITLFQGGTPSIKTVLLSLIGWESLGNSNWYIFVVCVLYLLTWISFSFVKNSKIKAALLLTLLTGAFIVVLSFIREPYWYDTALCYVLGVWISIFKDKFLKVITRNNLIWCLCAAGIFAVFCVLYLAPSVSIIRYAKRLLTAPVFCLVIAVILTKIHISNRILTVCGQYLFELYIFQRIPMILLKEWGVASVNVYLYFGLCIIMTILLARVFRFCTDRLDRILFTKGKQRSANDSVS